MNTETNKRLQFCTKGIHEKSGTIGSRKTGTKLFLSVAFVPVVLLGSAIVGQAQVIIAEHDFSVNTSATTLGSMAQSSAFSGSQLSSFPVSADGFGVVLQAYPSAGSSSAPAALANNSYWDLTITAQSGQFLDIGTLFFDVGKGGSSDPRGYFVRSSVDGFASDVSGVQLPIGAQQAPQPASVDFSGSPSYQGLTSVNFRFYVWSPTTGNSVDFRNVGLTAVAVPEPSSYALVFGLAGLGAVLWQRRRQQDVAGSPEK